jgi:hypothetical protein
MFNAHVLRTFIGSPSDVLERDFVKEALAEWSAKRSSAGNAVVFVPVRWETHAFPDLVAPGQTLIDERLVDTSDLCVALFWMKIGGSVDGASGTVHELRRFVDEGKRVLTYFNQQKISRRDAGRFRDDIAAVDELRNELQGVGLVGEYRSKGDLRAKLLDALDDVARGHIESHGPRHPPPGAPPSTATTSRPGAAGQGLSGG